MLLNRPPDVSCLVSEQRGAVGVQAGDLGGVTGVGGGAAAVHAVESGRRGRSRRRGPGSSEALETAGAAAGRPAGPKRCSVSTLLFATF